MYDGIGSISLVDNQKKFNSYSYDPFGNIESTATDINNIFAYKGYVYDSEIGNYYLNARYYDPSIARFTQEDTYGGDLTDPDTLNRYVYCTNDPISYEDPTGYSRVGPTRTIDDGFAPDNYNLPKPSKIKPTEVIKSEDAKPTDDIIDKTTRNPYDGFAPDSIIRSDNIKLQQELAKWSTLDLALGMLSEGLQVIPNFLSLREQIDPVKMLFKIMNGSIVSDNIFHPNDIFAQVGRGIDNTISSYTHNEHSYESGKILFDLVSILAGTGMFSEAGAAGKAATSAEKVATSVAEEALVSVEESTTSIGNVIAEGACFVAGTMIVTLTGNKAIEDIEVGDNVYSQNVETGEKAYKEVKNVFIKEIDTLVHLDIDGTKIDTTENHPFWIEGKGWIVAGELQVGDKVTLENGEKAFVRTVEIEKLDSTIKVYNFEVEDWHTYFVSEVGVLVHNQCYELPKGASKAGTGAYSEVGGHHVHAKAAFKGDPSYDFKKGFSISQDYMKKNGLSHSDMTAKQRQLFKELYESGRPNTLEEHTRIAREALKAGGANEIQIDELVGDSLKNLKEQGVTEPTRIPWYSK